MTNKKDISMSSSQPECQFIMSSLLPRKIPRSDEELSKSTSVAKWPRCADVTLNPIQTKTSPTILCALIICSLQFFYYAPYVDSLEGNNALHLSVRPSVRTN